MKMARREGGREEGRKGGRRGVREGGKGRTDFVLVLADALMIFPCMTSI